MDYSKILSKRYVDFKWSCGKEYSSLDWYEEIIPKPTQKELDLLWVDILKDEMRIQRNIL